MHLGWELKLVIGGELIASQVCRHAHSVQQPVVKHCPSERARSSVLLFQDDRSSLGVF